MRSFITTPIFYANAAPHVGHLYSLVIADSLRRWHNLKDPKQEAFLTCGMDEHGAKIAAAAAEKGVATQSYCDDISAQFRLLAEKFSVRPSAFVRTTDNSHTLAVQHFWKRLVDVGAIYKGHYEGWYSMRDEAFYSEEEVRNGVSLVSGSPVQLVQEENYMFRLSQFADRLKTFVTKTPVIQPEKFVGALLGSLNVVDDLSVSRDRRRVPWGIPVPGDPSQTIYVWLDALVNYLTAAGYPDTLQRWPPDCQIIGKDIIKFHALYWPAFLMAAGLELPKKIFVHSFWSVDNAKMSKSVGNVVCPMDEARVLTAEGLRYFLLRAGYPEHDCDYQQAKATDALNHDWANTLGNLLWRVMVPKLNPHGVYPPFDQHIFDNHLPHPQTGAQLRLLMRELPDRVAESYDELRFHRGIDAITAVGREAQSFIQSQQPWKLDQTRERPLNDTIHHAAFEAVRLCATLLQPVVPDLSRQIFHRLNVHHRERALEYVGTLGDSRLQMDGRPLGPISPLFPRAARRTEVKAR